MLSPYQIKTKLIEWFQNHAQVQQVVYADDFEFNAERQLTYPVVNLEFVNSTISDKMLNHTFKVVIGDVVPADDPELQLQVQSDSILVAEDFFAFVQDQEGWVFSRSSSLQPFKDDGGDRVSGVVFTVVLSVVRSQNTCVKPTN